MKTCAEYKAIARHKLLGNYGILILAYLIAQLVNLAVNLPFSNMIQQGQAFQVYSRVALGIIGTILVSLVVMLISCGQTYMQLQIARGKQTSLADLLHCFKNRPDRYIGYEVLLYVVAFLCVLPGCIVIAIMAVVSELNPDLTTVLAIIGIVLTILGTIILIIISLSWSMTIYLLLDNPLLKVMDAIRCSRQMMHGFKGKLFKLSLSFIGLLLLSVCTLGLGFLWVMPYMSQAITEFYLDLDLAINKQHLYKEK